MIENGKYGQKDADLVYDFVLNGYDNMQKEQLYGDTKMNMMQIHTLVTVYQNPGINVTQVSQKWGHTRSAASKNVTMLEKHGFLEKRRLPGNAKEIYLFATKKGEEAALRHMEYDRVQISRILERVSESHTDREIETFLSVLDVFNKFIKKENER